MIVIKNILKRYKKENIIALNSLSLVLNNNETVCLLGPNGAGKTTLIKCITSLIIPDKGEIYINNEKVNFNKNTFLDKIAVVLEGDRSLYLRLTVKSNLYYMGALKGIRKKQIDKNIKKYCELFNIKDFLNRRVNTLSLGQKQKVAIFTGIILEPQILILDEPSNGLDIESKKELITILNALKGQKDRIILIASHDIDFIRRIVDKIIIINKGNVIETIENKGLNNEIIEQKYMKNISGGNWR